MEAPESPLEAMLVRVEQQQAANMQAFMQAMQAIMGQIAQGQTELAAAITAPKEIIYQDGRPVGSRPVIQ